MHGCAPVRVCRCAPVWVRRCAGARMSRCAGAQVFGCARAQVCRHTRCEPEADAKDQGLRGSVAWSVQSRQTTETEGGPAQCGAWSPGLARAQRLQPHKPPHLRLLPRKAPSSPLPCTLHQEGATGQRTEDHTAFVLCVAVLAGHAQSTKPHGYLGIPQSPTPQMPGPSA